MKIKRIKKLHFQNLVLDVTWDSSYGGGSFDLIKETITIGTKYPTEILGIIVHELWEMCAAEMYLRFPRGDCLGEFIFVYDHRQHDTMSDMVTGLLQQFIGRNE